MGEDTREQRPDDADRVARRAELLPEEQAVGSDAPAEQAAVLLEDSDLRTDEPTAAPTTHLEHRTSEEAADPPL